MMLLHATDRTIRRTLMWCFVALVAGQITMTREPVRAGQTQTFDLVIRNGRVIDPGSGLDAIRNIGLRGGRIEEISRNDLGGREVIDATGLVVAPGFIDLHAHGQDPFSSRLQALDGVTTALELEAGVFPVTQWYAEREGRAAINFGATVSHGRVRKSVLGDDRSVYGVASDEQMREMESRIGLGLDQGSLGIGFGIAYTPGASREEIYRMFKVAAREGVVNFVHVRFAGQIEPGSAVEAVKEMIANSAATDAPVHIVHIGSSGLRQVPLLLEMIETARSKGLDITTEVYPYTAASTGIQAAIFDPGWRERLGADFGDIEWVASGERMTEDSFNRYREQGGTIIAHIIPEETVETALAHPLVMVASDGVGFVNGRAHPRGAGSFSRVLGRYVRERNVLSLMDALGKMTIMPARRLEDAVPQMRTKGRIRVGADADITIFDSNTVLDRATFAEPAQGSAGIIHVIVGGTSVVRDTEFVENAFPGRAVRRPMPR
jgi:N-acyl-D-aspartate/D-glutamate deacylase